ncbi:hypothetical protein WJX81_007914 [Elliptochloris bilobata]|uniref:Uncharacterized protein n=1 Tax=Elliptochloris bilobata TaxID=381761 RepID=A0AAW1R0P8_9CHLO
MQRLSGEGFALSQEDAIQAEYKDLFASLHLEALDTGERGRAGSKKVDELEPDALDTVRVEAGSQLIAHFDGDEEPLAKLATTRDLVVDVLGSEHAVRLEVARGSAVVYITFLKKDVAVGDIVVGLMLKGAQLTYISDPEGQAGFMTPVGEGSSWTWFEPARPARLRYAEFVSVPTPHGTRDSLALRVPAAIANNKGSSVAKYLHLQFQRGTTCVGVCKLPITSIIQALISQAVSQESGVEQADLLPGLRERFSQAPGSGWKAQYRSPV